MCVASLLHSNLLWESEVVFMSFILFLIYTLMVSTSINIALLTILYINWTNKELKKYQHHILLWTGNVVLFNILCGNVHFYMFISYLYYKTIIMFCQINLIYLQRFRRHLRPPPPPEKPPPPPEPLLLLECAAL